MENLVRSLEMALESRNWYAALIVALTIPEICGYLENPKEKSQPRYEDWYKRYMLAKYSSYFGPNRELHIFLSPADCYALRCSLLHQGSDDISETRAREVLERFHFIVPPPNNNVMHCNQLRNVLQLQVDVFCQDVVAGVNQWLSDSLKKNDITERMKQILTIHLDPTFPGFIGSA